MYTYSGLGVAVADMAGVAVAGIEAAAVAGMGIDTLGESANMQCAQARMNTYSGLEAAAADTEVAAEAVAGMALEALRKLANE
jgi:hypothetical protein